MPQVFAQACGKLDGMVVNFGAIGTVLQGGPQIFVDSSKTPQIPSTGSEEWGLGGNWFNNGTQDSLPLGGLPSPTNNPPGTDVEGAALYRFMIADAIAFNSHITVDWEHGGVARRTESATTGTCAAGATRTSRFRRR